MKKPNMGDIVKDSSKLKEALVKRWEELNVKHTDVERDAKSRGQNITANAISKYLSDAYQKGALNQFHILFLAFRWDIPVLLTVGYPSVPFTGEVLPYDEQRALKMLYKYFPATLKPKATPLKHKVIKRVTKKIEKPKTNIKPKSKTK
jgi:hypothetical protein